MGDLKNGVKQATEELRMIRNREIAFQAAVDVYRGRSDVDPGILTLAKKFEKFLNGDKEQFWGSSSNSYLWKAYSVFIIHPQWGFIFLD